MADQVNQNKHYEEEEEKTIPADKREELWKMDVDMLCDMLSTKKKPKEQVKVVEDEAKKKKRKNEAVAVLTG